MNDQVQSGSGPISPNMALVRAIYDWSTDNGLTPMVLVDVNAPGVEVPMAYAKKGKIVLNIHPNAVQDLCMDNGYLLFSARFSGRPMNITLPLESVLAVYARENGKGVMLQPDIGAVASHLPGEPSREKKGKQDAVAKTASSAHLKVIK